MILSHGARASVWSGSAPAAGHAEGATRGGARPAREFGRELADSPNQQYALGRRVGRERQRERRERLAFECADGRTRGLELLLRAAPFRRREQGSRRQERQRVLEEHGKWRDRPGHREVEAPAQVGIVPGVLGPRTHDSHVLHAERRAGLPQEGTPPPVRFDERESNLRVGDSHRDSWEARSASNIDDPRGASRRKEFRLAERREQRERFAQVAARDPEGVAHGGEPGARGAGRDEGAVRRQLVVRPAVEGEAEPLTLRGEPRGRPACVVARRRVIRGAVRARGFGSAVESAHGWYRTRAFSYTGESYSGLARRQSAWRGAAPTGGWGGRWSAHHTNSTRRGPPRWSGGRLMAGLMTAGDASAHYLNSLEPEKARAERPALDRFIEELGGEERPIGEITGEEVEQYAATHAEALEHDADHAEPIRGFLAYASRLAFTAENLVPHLGEFAGGARGGRGAIEELGGEAFYMTFEGIQALEEELKKLKDERPRIAEELRAAMADKDFRENAPLDAARDSQAHLEARIREIENRLRHAVVIDAEAKGGRAHVGSTVRVLNMERDVEQVFHLVSPSQVDPTKGRISVESPVGFAVANHTVGDEVTVTAPGGSMRLRLLVIEG